MSDETKASADTTPMRLVVANAVTFAVMVVAALWVVTSASPPAPTRIEIPVDVSTDYTEDTSGLDEWKGQPATSGASKALVSPGGIVEGLYP